MSGNQSPNEDIFDDHFQWRMKRKLQTRVNQIEIIGEIYIYVIFFSIYHQYYVC